MSTGIRGGVSVGRLADLSPVQIEAVHMLRRWDGSGTLPKGSGGHFGRPCHTPGAHEVMTEICALCARFGRRPLMRHGNGCTCLGADESCFALLVDAAVSGDHEDALLVACLIVRADMAPALAGLAGQLGLELLRHAPRLPRTGGGGAAGTELVH